MDNLATSTNKITIEYLNDKVEKVFYIRGHEVVLGSYHASGCVHKFSTPDTKQKKIYHY